LQKPKHYKHIYISLQFANDNMLLGLLGWSQAKCVEEFFFKHKRRGTIDETTIKPNQHWKKQILQQNICIERRSKMRKWMMNVQLFWWYNATYDARVEWTKCHLVISTIELIAYTSYFKSCWRNLQLQKIFDKLQELPNQAQKRHMTFSHMNVESKDEAIRTSITKPTSTLIAFPNSSWDFYGYCGQTNHSHE